MRRLRSLIAVAILGSLLAGLTACGGATGSSSSTVSGSPGASGSVTSSGVTTVTGPPTDPGSSTPPYTSDMRASLRIQIWERGRAAGAPAERTLTCSTSAAGTVSNPDAACEQLARLGEKAFAPTPSDQACTMIYGGASVATIDGTIDGKPVHASYSLANGCEIARWNRLPTILVVNQPTPTNVTP